MGEQNTMLAFVMIFAGIIVGLSLFGVAAVRWGHDSREPFDSPEWKRRQRWLRP
jgi:hypothetical protein